MDGIALLALGPDTLRWHLGLPPGARLPLAVSCEPEGQTGEIDVERQIAAVSSSRFVSAAEASLEAGKEVGAETPLRWLLPKRTRYPRNSGDVYSLASSFEDGQSLPLDAARRKWADAMRWGEVSLVPWTAIRLRTALEDCDALGAEHPVLGELVETVGDHTDRSTVIRVLDEFRVRHGEEECREAFRWWVEKYYDAICDANDEMRISFHPTSRSSNDSDTWERTRDRRRWQVVRARLARREIPPRSEIPFEGEIVENMRIVQPESFQRLRCAPSRVHEFWARPSNRQIWDLALTVRRTVADPGVHRSRLMWALLGKLLLALTVAALLGLRDVRILPTDTVWWLVFWAAIAFVLTVPWTLVRALVDLSSFSVTGTLRIADDRVASAHVARSSATSVGSPRELSKPESDVDAVAPIPVASWREVWRASDFDLAVERSTAKEERAVHRVVTMHGRDGAVALCRNRSGDGQMPRTLLVRSRRGAVGAVLWELPRGFGEPRDDSPESTALREVREETGLSATSPQLLGTIYPDSGLLASAIHVVLLEVERPDFDVAGTDGEVEAQQWCTPAEVTRLIRTGLIADGITLAALHLAEHTFMSTESEIV